MEEVKPATPSVSTKQQAIEQLNLGEILIPCECKGHAIEALCYEFGGVWQINLMMLTADYGCNGWRDRIRLAWRMLRHGRAECTDIELSPVNARLLGEWLLQQAGEK